MYYRASRRQISQKEQSPGPATYGPLDADVYKQRRPKYTIAGRYEGVKKGTVSPGPAAYAGYVPKNCMGGLSFGHRTNKLPYITAADDTPCLEH